MSLTPREEEGREREENLGSDSAWILWLVERRPLLETRRPILLSFGSPEELGLLLETIALFDELTWKEVEVRPLCESCCKMPQNMMLKNIELM